MANQRTGQKRVEVGELIPVVNKVVRNASRSTRCVTSKDIKPQLEEQEWHNRLRPIYLLLQQVKQCKRETVREDNLYEDLLTVLGIELFTSLRQLNVSVKPSKLPVFKSAWKQHICLALDSLGIHANYMAVANWIAENHPDSPLPRFCNEFTEECRDIGYLTANYDRVRVCVDRDVSYVRVKMSRRKTN